MRSPFAVPLRTALSIAKELRVNSAKRLTVTPPLSLLKGISL